MVIKNIPIDDNRKVIIIADDSTDEEIIEIINTGNVYYKQSQIPEEEVKATTMGMSLDGYMRWKYYDNSNAH